MHFTGHGNITFSSRCCCSWVSAVYNCFHSSQILCSCWKNFYFDLVNISAHLVLWASKVREQISKRPPGSSILGSQTVLSISSAKRSYNVEMRRRTFNQGHGNFWLRWPLLVSLARCGGMFTICTLMIKGTCIILVKMWEIERKKKNALQMYKAKASKVLLLMFLSDLVRVNNASSFKDEVSSTDLLLFSFSLVLIPSFFLNKIHMYSHILWRRSE